MQEKNKTAFSVFLIILLAVFFIVFSAIFNSVYGKDKEATDNADENMIETLLGEYVSYEKTDIKYDGIDDIFKVELKSDSGENETVYVVTAQYAGFSQKVKIASCFKGAQLLKVAKLSTKGISSFYDERVLRKEFLDRFHGTLSTDPDLDHADRDFIEIDPIEENDVASKALLNSVDNCCKAYFETVINKGGENGE